MEYNDNLQHQPSNLFEEQNPFLREEYERGVRRARNTLFATGIILIIGDLMSLIINGKENFDLTIVLGIDTAILALYVFLGFFTRRSPYNSILIGLIVFLLIQGVISFIDISNLYTGMLGKIIILILLIRGLNSAKRLQELRSRDEIFGSTG